MPEKRDYYEVLGVEKDASAKSIKTSYKSIALANHPDRNPDDESAVERFKEAAEAFEVLSDPDFQVRDYLAKLRAQTGTKWNSTVGCSMLIGSESC